MSPFSHQIKTKLFEMLSDTNESNAQRNKLGLQATTSSALSSLRHEAAHSCNVVQETPLSLGVPSCCL